MESVSSLNSLIGHQINIKQKSSKKKSPSAVRKSKARMCHFNSMVLKIKCLHEFYPDMQFNLLKTKMRPNGPHIGWMKINYNQCDDEPKETIALLKSDQAPFKIDKNFNFFQNCQEFQKVTDYEGKRIMSSVVNHLDNDMKKNDPCCSDCAFNPNCFFLYCQLRKDNG